jgi:hypothetical protein
MNDNRREQNNYHKLIGRIGNDYYFLDYTFSHGDGFKGATGTVLTPVGKNEYEDRTDPESETCQEWFREIWKMAVENNDTDKGLEDWVFENISAYGDEGVFDFSGYDLWEQLREIGLNEDDYPVFECIGGGRCFDVDMVFDEIYDKELWEEIKKFEKEKK